MGDIGLSVMTPEKAFDFYRSLVEDFDQAVPIMMAETAEGDLNVIEMVGAEVRDMLGAMASRGDRYRAVLLSVEARMWSFKYGELETEGPVDAATFTYVDQTGKSWMATRKFIRITEGNVRWGDLETVDPGATGAVPENLQRLVAADI